jgi:hypothetical protein
MSRCDKSSCTDKRKRQAADIKAGYEVRDVPAGEAERVAWPTIKAVRLAERPGSCSTTRPTVGHGFRGGGLCRRR